MKDYITIIIYVQTYVLLSEICTLQIIIDLKDGDGFQLIMLYYLFEMN